MVLLFLQSLKLGFQTAYHLISKSKNIYVSGFQSRGSMSQTFEKLMTFHSEPSIFIPSLVNDFETKMVLKSKPERT